MNKYLNRKNKGFTLIEILAAVIILGIIGIIAVVAVTNYISDSRKSTFINIARMYVEEARGIKARDELVQDPKNTEAVLVPFKELKLDNQDDYQTPYGTLILEKSYVLVVNNGNKISYYVAMMDDSGHAIAIENVNELGNDSVTNKKMYTDAIKPVLAIKNAESTIEIDGSVYELSDKNLDNVSTVLLDNSVLGLFRVEYNRDWYNEDKKIIIIANNATDDYEYYLGGRLQKPSRTDSLWQKSNEYVRGMGTYYAFIKSPSGEVSDGVKVVIDKIDKNPPICKLKATGTATDKGIFITDAVVSFEVANDGAVSSTTSGVKRYGIGSLESSNFKVHLVSGPSEINYTGYIEDNAGNVSTCELTVRSDSIEPDINYSVLGGNYNTDQTVVITPIDDDSGVDYYHVYVYKNDVIQEKYENLKTENHTVVLDDEGTYEIRTTVVDLAGNKTDKEPQKDGWYYQTYVIDKTKPTLEISKTGGAFKATGSLTITVLDEGGSGLSEENIYQYCLSTSGTSVTGCTWTTYTSGMPFTVSGTNTTKYLWVYPIKDNNNNINGTYTDITEPYMIGSYRFDSTKPTLKVEITDKTTVKLTAADTGGSGLSSSNKYQYCLSKSSSSVTGCTWTPYTSGTAFTVNGTGVGYLFIYPIADVAGNINDSHTNVNTPYLVGNFEFDTVKPTLTVTTTYNSSTQVSVKITAADNVGGSGLASSNKYQYCLSTSSSSATGCTWTNYTSGTAFTVSGTAGNYYLWVYSITDNSGNANDSYTNNTTAYKIQDLVLFSSVQNYSYTGAAQTYTVNVSGYYKVELWGAQGGNYNSTYTGGKGAYTRGTIYLNKGETLYVYVGAQGNTFNGGGSSGSYGKPGGGATDVRLVSGAWNNTTGLNSRIMVAAGGGGGSSYNSENCGRGGNGGTFTGGGPSSMCVDTSEEGRYGTTGSQTAGGNSAGFGTGGAGAGGGAGGGGGYYGGGGARNTSWGGPGAGGSSYISGLNGTIAITSETNRAAKCSSGSSVSCATHYSGKVFEHRYMQAGVQSGNGKATITFLYTEKPLNEATNLTYSHSTDYYEYTVLKTGYYKIELWGAQGGNYNSTYTGGKGAYTRGEIYLTQGEKLYFYVGGQGNIFNGGGQGGSYGGTGGGATDVRLYDSDWNESTSLNSRIMVAAGGGGGSSYNSENCGRGGNGGTFTGGGPSSMCVDTSDYSRYGTAGSQTAGGNSAGFGTGAAGAGGGAGGGGGYYGGGGARNTSWGGPGGGGSSYVSGITGAIAITSASSRTAKCSSGTSVSCATHYSGKVFEHRYMQAGVQSGNGKATITYIGETRPLNTATNLTYSHSTDYYEYTALKTGTYKIELWGAQGGNYNSTYTGGKGSYTSGQIYLTQGEKLYFYVGAQGNIFNGGGQGGSYGGTGGGATDVRLYGSDWNEPTSLNSRIMVAAGGGGGSSYNSANCGKGGIGGTTSGGNPSSMCVDTSDYSRYGTAGSQTTGGNSAGFGNGASGAGGGAGGGGGYYGGGGARNTSWGGPGAGASSYISGHTGFIAITSATSRTAKCSSGSSVACATHYSGKVFTSTTASAGNASMPSHDGASTMAGNSGNGYAKITLIN